MIWSLKTIRLLSVERTEIERLFGVEPKMFDHLASSGVAAGSRIRHVRKSGASPHIRAPEAQYAVRRVNETLRGSRVNAKL